MVKEKLDKLFEIGFIYQIPNSEQIFPIVIVSKKSGKIKSYQDFRKLNAATNKDYFLLPFMDSILDIIVWHEYYSFLDGFFGYNQVKIVKEDQLKIAFTIQQRIFAYRIMPFGLRNAPGTFQRVMIQAFQDYL